jgi:ferritin-like metal-binding protein YciE
MGELDGVWNVERVSGALPPLVGVRKRIRGERGETQLGSLPGAPFDVRGNELHYRAPFTGFVDVLEPDGDGVYAGRATFRGREVGRFRLVKEGTVRDLDDQLVKHIDEAYAMEQNVLRMLDGMISTTDDAELLDDLERHREETKRHAERMRERLAAHDAAPSAIREIGGIMGALMKVPLDMLRGEKAGRNARDGYATEHMEIASYELLERIAARAGDEETAEAARQNRADEEAMAQKLAASWDRIVDLSLAEEGVEV